jgi:hypothetical protein
VAVPRLQDALQTLATAVSNALNAAGVAQPNQVGAGEPNPNALVSILKAGGFQVLLHDRGATRDMSRFEMDTFTVTNPESPLVATVVDDTLTFSGSVVAGLNVHTFIGYPVKDAYYETLANDTLASIAVAVAAKINALGISGVSATASGAVVISVGSPVLFCNIGGLGLVMATEVARLRRSIQVTAWCPNPTLRYQVLDAIESQIGTQLQPFLYLSDGTCMQVEFATSNAGTGTLMDKDSQSYGAFVVNIVYDCEYPVLAYAPGGEIESVDNALTVNDTDSASVVVGGLPSN